MSHLEVRTLALALSPSDWGVLDAMCDAHAADNGGVVPPLDVVVALLLGVAIDRGLRLLRAPA